MNKYFAMLVIIGATSEITGVHEIAGSQVESFSARWLGQDGKDFVGPNNRLEPSDVQDVHIILQGLDPERDIIFVEVTGAGGDQWHYNSPSFAWKAELRRSPRATSADLYIEPGNLNSPRNYELLIRYEGGGTARYQLWGRKVNSQLRMPGTQLSARWIGVELNDRVGSDHGVGPDGIQDVRVRLSGVSSRVPVRAIRIDGSGDLKWESGANPRLLPLAEYYPDKKVTDEGDLYFQPDRDLSGQRLKVHLLYTNDQRDTAILVAGPCKKGLAMPEHAMPTINPLPCTAVWKGQDRSDVTGPGDVHVCLNAIKDASLAIAAVLTDSARGTWIYRKNGTPKLNEEGGDLTGALGLKVGSGGSSLDIYFAPYRDERGTRLTLRLIDQDGTVRIITFPGGRCDPNLREPMPADTQVEARPGDDLNHLANRYGTVRLLPGIHRLTRPLVLNGPVVIKGSRGTQLRFVQDPGEPPWTSAIKIHAGNTTLDGFAVRFEGQVRWNPEVSYGPAVIGTTDDRDRGPDPLKFNIVLTGLDLEIPPAIDPSRWVDALRLVRLTHARSGRISSNILRGGMIEFFDGPWEILDNEFRGTPPGTISHGVFTGHTTHDLTIKGNRVRPIEPDGKTWRFLVLTHRSCGDLVEGNTIEALGSREGDTIPWSNEPEIILTEGYHLTYEGKILGLSMEGRLIRTGTPQGQPAVTGDVLSLLDGPKAGQWRRIAQVLDAQTYLLDDPVPADSHLVSISRGFVEETFRRNRIDIRTGRRSDGMVFVGNHFGTQIRDNHILGGDHALRLTACPTESPVEWGWSHAPYLGGSIVANVIEDSEKGAVLGVEHSTKSMKSNKGRTYMSVSLDRNVIRWSEPFLRRFAISGSKRQPPGLVLGFLPAHDPNEFLVTARENWLDAPRSIKVGPSLIVNAASFNTKSLMGRHYALPRSPAKPVPTGRNRESASLSGQKSR